ncbi:aldo/keto reductase [Marinobacterium jannaschii]|uniref:aldo/keto reductase n=1 Tax=Marinobacterium jannaschii TaxID=64970 RepID=UPI0006874E0E|nr:aldo/keto reductase [Marinobacterium jannaschii]
MTPDKIAIGGAQFGLDYGINNTTGIVKDARQLLRHAYISGIRTLDTAKLYGSSESAIGNAIEPFHSNPFDIVTKLPPIPDGTGDIKEWVENQARDSIRKLGCHQLYALLLHRPNQLSDKKIGQCLYEALNALVDSGLVKKIGISVYNPAELEILERFKLLNIVQLPINTFDRRFLDSGSITSLAERKIEIHARSIFLQGLLLMSKSDLPPYFHQWLSILDAWHNFLRSNDLTPIEGCISFIKQVPHLDKVVIGIDSLDNLVGILNAVESTKTASINILDLPSSSNEKLIAPSNWKFS